MQPSGCSSSIANNSNSNFRSNNNNGSKLTLGSPCSSPASLFGINQYSTTSSNIVTASGNSNSNNISGSLEMNSVLHKLDIRRPSIASASLSSLDDMSGPNGADSADHPTHTSSGNSSSMNNNGSNTRVADEIDVVIIGDENKARFITRFLNNGIQLDPTIDVPCRRPVMIKSGTYNVNIHTNVGQEEFWGINDMYNRQGHGFIFVYNVNSRESFNMFLQLREKILFDKGTENVLMSLVGYGEHEIDRETGERRQREVPFAEAKRLADLYSYPIKEIPHFGVESEQHINACVSDLLHRITHFHTGASSSSTGSSAHHAGAQGAAGGKGGATPQSHNSAEIVVLGDLFVGKTQFIQRCVASPFSNSYRETTEWTKTVIQSQMNDVRYFLKMTDTRGLFAEEGLTRERLLSSQAFIFMYSITSRNSFTCLDALRKKVMACKSESRHIPCILIGNKSDCLTLARQVTTGEGEELAKRWGCPFFELSMRSSDDEDVLKSISHLLLELQKNSLNNIDVGEFKKEGYLMKEGKKLKSMTKYYFRIKRGSLQYCKNQSSATKNNKTIELADSVHVQAQPHNEKKGEYPFSLLVDGKQIVLVAASESERDQWITAIKVNCYVNEFLTGLLDDVLTTMVGEIAHQSLAQLHKRSDSNKSFSSMSSISSPTEGSSVSTSYLSSSSSYLSDLSSSFGAGESPGVYSPSIGSSTDGISTGGGTGGMVVGSGSGSPSPLKRNILQRSTSFKKH
ncbi:hypothetical protein SAMD00019534_001760 [Acytostelium subglobosum LB1]|uniref:hypothetical protein n=1 Tax=Acytostelium subglobosum LB1 TaxID=1410327 RepID=UPI000644D271|nr:hypothetical protein SAMD00019534_001760 [Acytostelium subglobosum LB1]GAM17001.1 hypothetical protein SAMD00019534_001760 [Acytostelium subglobosum LB1]|eukprot:XP_012759063.1 hypothetical protein SAMD00019534_001760 [Acytostelium subglobosum LB1]